MTTLQRWLQSSGDQSSLQYLQVTGPRADRGGAVEWNENDDDLDDGLLLAVVEAAEQECPGFDAEAGNRYVYPTNLPIRDYQFNITQTALFNNTLVALPTGLGKTLVAAVVIYNFQRWYPTKKILFMAPTKPLVSQQIDACRDIMRLPANECCSMTGTMSADRRALLWKQKRVFFLTPQVVRNDLHRGTCPSAEICLVVIDEAHRAQGGYAYVEVVEELQKNSRNFRVVALSATPGENLQAVQQVLEKLLISKIELRTEDCSDVQPYIKDRLVRQIKVPLSPEIEEYKQIYIQLLRPVLQNLQGRGGLWNFNLEKVTNLRNSLIVCKNKFQGNRQFGQGGSAARSVDRDFSLALSLAHSFELLQTHGLWCLYQSLLSASCGAQRPPQMALAGVRQVLSRLDEHFGEAENQPGRAAFSHPKLIHLVKVVREHFLTSGSESTRVIIFSQFRWSVEEIAMTLRPLAPLIRPAEFIGQNSSGPAEPGQFHHLQSNASKGLTQREQQKVLDDFRSGHFNTLVATSVAEEGLDIGAVDLIVCFDVQQSSLRMVQRMGRTGRKHQGKVVVLLVPGIEDRILAKAEDKQKKLSKEILRHSKRFAYYEHSPRMVPSGINPQPLCIPMDKANQQPTPQSKGSHSTPSKGPHDQRSIKKYLAHQSCDKSVTSEQPTCKGRGTFVGDDEAFVRDLSNAFLDDGFNGDSRGNTCCSASDISRKHSHHPCFPDVDVAVSEAVGQLFRPAQFHCCSLAQQNTESSNLSTRNMSRKQQMSLSFGRWFEEQRMPSSVHRVSHSGLSLAFVQLMNAAGSGEFSKQPDMAVEDDNGERVFTLKTAACAMDEEEDDDFVPQREKMPLLSASMEPEATLVDPLSPEEDAVNVGSPDLFEDLNDLAVLLPLNSSAWDVSCSQQVHIAAPPLFFDGDLSSLGLGSEDTDASAQPNTVSGNGVLVEDDHGSDIDIDRNFHTERDKQSEKIQALPDLSPKSKESSRNPSAIKPWASSTCTKSMATSSYLVSEVEGIPAYGNTSCDKLDCVMAKGETTSNCTTVDCCSNTEQRCPVKQDKIVGTPLKRTKLWSRLAAYFAQIDCWDQQTSDCTPSIVPWLTLELNEVESGLPDNSTEKEESPDCDVTLDSVSGDGCKEFSVANDWSIKELVEGDSILLNERTAAHPQLLNFALKLMQIPGGGTKQSLSREVSCTKASGCMTISELVTAQDKVEMVSECITISEPVTDQDKAEMDVDPLGSPSFDADELMLLEMDHDIGDEGHSDCHSPIVCLSKFSKCHSPDKQVCLSEEEDKLFTGLDAEPEQQEPIKEDAVSPVCEVSFEESHTPVSTNSNPRPVLVSDDSASPIARGRRRKVNPRLLLSQEPQLMLKAAGSDSDEDDSPLVVRQRHCAILTSPDTQFDHSQQKTAEQRSANKRLQNTPQRSKPCWIDEDSDFEEPLAQVRKRLCPPAVEKHPSAQQKPSQERTKHCDLLDVEAEESGGSDTHSGDDEDADRYDVDDSFINDATQLSQSLISCSQTPITAQQKKVDMHTVYMRSLLSPHANCCRQGGVRLVVSRRHRFLQQALGEEGVDSDCSTDSEASVNERFSMEKEEAGDETGEDCDEEGDQVLSSLCNSSLMAECFATDDSDHSIVCSPRHEPVGDEAAVLSTHSLPPRKDGAACVYRNCTNDETAISSTRSLRCVKKEKARPQQNFSDVKMFSPHSLSSLEEKKDSAHGKHVDGKASVLPTCSVSSVKEESTCAQSSRLYMHSLKIPQSHLPSAVSASKTHQSSVKQSSSAAAASSRHGSVSFQDPPVSSAASNSTAANQTVASGKQIQLKPHTPQTHKTSGMLDWLNSISMDELKALAAANGLTPMEARRPTNGKLSARPLPSPSSNMCRQPSSCSESSPALAKNAASLKVCMPGHMTPTAFKNENKNRMQSTHSVQSFTRAEVSGLGQRSGEANGLGQRSDEAIGLGERLGEVVSGLGQRSTTPSLNLLPIRSASSSAPSSSSCLFAQCVKSRPASASDVAAASPAQTSHSFTKPPLLSASAKPTGGSGVAHQGPLHLLVGSNHPTYVQIVSVLRHQHSGQVHVHFCSLHHSGIVLSQRMVAECLPATDLANSERRRHLVNRVQQLRRLYSSVMVILLSSSGEMLAPGCEDALFDLITASHLTPLWTENHESAAQLLVEIAKQQAELGAAITAWPDQFPNDSFLQLLVGISGISLTAALHVRAHFNSVNALLQVCNSAQVLQQQLPLLRLRQATNIMYFMRLKFTPSMLPAKS